MTNVMWEMSLYQDCWFSWTVQENISKPYALPYAQGRGGSQGRPRGGSGGRGFGRGRGRGRGRGEKVSAEDLDADLEKYHSEAMQIN
ncbi:hypothetical protein CK203_007334 [Vitis vinifera]|uniref:Chromatin target of PRMT1 protein C-terminal domain-containing protein n=1 Tax=Vitis vinifera TaxID=29760 RepID=A0A438G0Q6_VITVI|nr:hypothetical protein CK203_007334 [Vitis vinifera]